MQKYNFYELNGYQLIEKYYQNGNEPIDFSTHTNKILTGIIKSVDMHNDNAMFYQVKKCLYELQDSDGTEIFQNIISNWDKDPLKNILIYIDFSGVFPLEKYASKKYKWSKMKNLSDDEIKVRKIQTANCERIVEDFFSNGFSIQHPDPIGIVHYVPFEKSASMARSAAMIFIDKRLYERMEQRLHLGFNFSGDKVSASKLYAYTGLYLSDAKRIDEKSNFELNQETVIILSDNVITYVNKEKNTGREKKRPEFPFQVISGEKKGVIDQDGFQKWPIKEYAVGEYETKVNLFDGEGLISPNYCSVINDILNSQYGMLGTASSIQIRMPFTKGMLHNVNFHGFICEKLGLESCKDIWVLDAYGHRRNLEKAQIILTQSMFKIDKWLTNPKISSIDENEDPLIIYFNRFHEYDHAFYVGITDMDLSQVGKTKLNYQFLNTLALTDEELEEIIDEQVKLGISGNTKDLLRDVISDNIKEDMDTSFDDAIKEKETWYEVAARNPAFLNDPKVKGMLNGVRYSLLKDIGRGRLIVKGSTKFLSRDLLALLSFIIGKIDSNDTISGEQKRRIRDEIKKEQLWRTRFYVADCVPGNPVFFKENRRLHLNSNYFYGLLRSPHLSRNEQCSLNPFIPHKDSAYTNYFGHLKGIIMVSQFSFVPQALGGADFDGDLVKLITDRRVNRAINDSCYNTETNGISHVRKLPIVMIPDSLPRKIKLLENKVDFRTLKDTFSSKVGELSNRAFYLGKREYDENNPNPKYNLNCEIGTILVGLEIDAAKTGRHPYLNEYLPDDRERDYFITRKEAIDKLPELYAFDVLEYQETQNTKGKVLPHRLSAVAQYGLRTGDELISGVFVDEYDNYYQIDRLPQRFLSELSALKNSKKTTNIKGDVRFAFEKKIDWKKRVSDPEKINLVKDLIYSYRRIIETTRNVYRFEDRIKKSNYVGCINTIFRIQNKEHINESQLSAFQEKIFNQLLSLVDSYKSADTVLKDLVKNRHWQFCETDEEKIIYLEKLFCNFNGVNLDKEVLQALVNFRWNGYFLLYFYIKDIMLYYLETETELRIAQGENQSTLGYYPDRFYEEFRYIFDQALSEKESKKIWKKKIVEKCRCILRKEFSNRVDFALMYTQKLRNCDRYGTFFWDIFTANEILYRSEVFSDAE